VFLLVPAYLACPGPKAVKRLCVCVFVMYSLLREVSVVSHFCGYLLHLQLSDDSISECCSMSPAVSQNVR